MSKEKPSDWIKTEKRQNRLKMDQDNEIISNMFQGESEKSYLKTIFFYNCVAPIEFGFIGYYLNHTKELQKERAIYKIQK